jgi:hypothetical protein
MTAHTPGPWVITPHPTPNVDVFGVGEVMDDKETQYALSHTICYQNAEANARLIAAAPELLEALVEIMEQVGGYVPDTDKSAWSRASQIIAKAKGEQP